jgi:hypothetical protein
MRDQIYTELAGHAIELTSIFSLFVGSTPIPTTGGVFAIDLTKPHGPSTGGGTQALQHITLIHGDLTVVVGTLDQTTKKIEMRALELVGSQFRARWKKPLAIQPADYDALIARVRVFAKSQSFLVAIKSRATEPVPVIPARARWSWSAFEIGAMIIGFGAVVALYLWRR